MSLLALTLALSMEGHPLIENKRKAGAVIRQILKAEGGYVDDPNDNGGETKYGISKRAYPDEDIKNLTIARAVYLYERDYWSAIRGDELPDALALVVMDMAVNAGVPRASRMLQQLIGADVDGRIGPNTIKAAAWFYSRHGDNAIKWYSRDRILYYSGLDDWRFFKKGWTQRVIETTIIATSWHVAIKILESKGVEA